MNFRPRVTGGSLEYKLNRTGARKEPWGRLLRWGLQELVSLPMCTLKRRSWCWVVKVLVWLFCSAVVCPMDNTDGHPGLQCQTFERHVKPVPTVFHAWLPAVWTEQRSGVPRLNKSKGHSNLGCATLCAGNAEAYSLLNLFSFKHTQD